MTELYTALREKLKEGTSLVLKILDCLDCDAVQIEKYVGTMSSRCAFYSSEMLGYYLISYDTINWRAASIMYVNTNHEKNRARNEMVSPHF